MRKKLQNKTYNIDDAAVLSSFVALFISAACSSETLPGFVLLTSFLRYESAGCDRTGRGTSSIERYSVT